MLLHGLWQRPLDQPPCRGIRSTKGGSWGAATRLWQGPGSTAPNAGGAGVLLPTLWWCCGLTILARWPAATKGGAGVLLPTLWWGPWALPASQQVHSTKWVG